MKTVDEYLYDRSSDDSEEEDENDEDDDNVPLQGLLPQIQPQHQGEAVTETIDVGEAEVKDENRKHGDAIRKEEATPQPTSTPAVGMCLRGTLVCNLSEEFSVNNSAVHLITGLWSMIGLTNILNEPSKCKNIE